MIVYVDSSALLKRVIEETESETLENTLDQYIGAGDALVASSLAWLEVSRGLLRLAALADIDYLQSVGGALSGVSELPVTPGVLRIAGRIAPFELSSLYAIHLATAVLHGADIVLTYDARLAGASRQNGLRTVSPGS